MFFMSNYFRFHGWQKIDVARVAKYARMKKTKRWQLPRGPGKNQKLLPLTSRIFFRIPFYLFPLKNSPKLQRWFMKNSFFPAALHLCIAWFNCLLRISFTFFRKQITTMIHKTTSWIFACNERWSSFRFCVFFLCAFHSFSFSLVIVDVEGIIITLTRLFFDRNGGL